MSLHRLCMRCHRYFCHGRWCLLDLLWEELFGSCKPYILFPPFTRSLVSDTQVQQDLIVAEFDGVVGRPVSTQNSSEEDKAEKGFHRELKV